MNLKTRASVGSLMPKARHLLGGSRFLKGKPSSQAEIHAAVVEGIPYSMLFFLTDNCKGVAEEDVASVLGVSTRTLRRQKDTPEKIMPADLGSRTWMLAETLAKAEDVMGSKEDAQRWLVEEAMGLDGARPIDLMCTMQGANLVSQFLERLKHGVYN
jgi:putative toxin-antitoxin system antitoxin component (TIGR02293 family)